MYAKWDAATSVGLSASTAVQRRREIDKDLMPNFSGQAIPSVIRLELTMALKAVEVGVPEVAHNLRNHVWRIFEYAIDTELIKGNPVPPVRALRKRNRQNHFAPLPRFACCARSCLRNAPSCSRTASIRRGRSPSGAQTR